MTWNWHGRCVCTKKIGRLLFEDDKIYYDEIYCNFWIGFNFIPIVFAYVYAVLMKSEKIGKKTNKNWTFIFINKLK